MSGEVVYIYDGLRRWWSDRRIKLALIIAVVIGIIIGHILALVFANETLAKAQPFYREMVARGDAAIAMLKAVHDKIAEVEGQPDRNRQRVKIAQSVSEIANIVKGNSPTIDPKIRT